MSSALLALSWELLARQRWVVRLTAAHLAAVCAVVPFLPSGWRCPELALAALALLPAWMIPMVGGLSHGEEARLELPGGGLPRHLHLLPVPTWALVAPPLVLGALAVGGA